MDHDDAHEAFASSRSRDYVYIPGDDEAFHLLDQHAETVEGDVRDPVVILGSPGSGKSALLANWVQRRRQYKHRDEFLFQHFVGCSPRSKRLSHLLFRLESALKDFFQLREMEVPKSEDRLRWALSRFLYSAAKKHYPARIVVVLDGVDKLVGDTVAEALHWLPTKLEPGVRFILSTSEYEQYAPNGAEPPDGSKLHRTWMELNRRNCPSFRIEPLTMDVRHSIIESFLEKYNTKNTIESESADIGSGLEGGWLKNPVAPSGLTHPPSLDLDSASRFKIATAKPSSQPMFLRTILYALRLGMEMSNVTINEQITMYLSAESPEVLISQVFDLCSTYVESGNENNDRNILGRVLSVLYASRHGLSEEEIWGSVEMGLGSSISSEAKQLIVRILDDVTMQVSGLRMFSHEDYQQAVYEKYIQTPELNVRLHLLMARYFGRLEPCDRKLESLPYHLEVSGSWTKLKNALAGVDMFKLWWTPKHKSEFISLWASLADRNNPKTPIRRLVTGEFDSTMRCNQATRPCFDIVEEFVKSCDEYKYSANPTPEELAEILLRIADFLLEFATLGLEVPADVPQFVHPMIPNSDLETLGVPFLDTQEEGLSVLRTPVLSDSRITNKPLVETPAKLNEEIPEFSTYFFHRWMWIQFPWIALANCGGNYHKGVAYANSVKRAYKKEDSQNIEKSIVSKGKIKPISSVLTNQQSNPSHNKLPSIGVPMRKYISKTHTIPQPKPGEEELNEDFIEKQISMSEQKVRYEIEDRRRHLDHLRDQKAALERAKQRLLDESRDLEKMHFGSTELERKRDSIGSKIEETEASIASEKDLHRNYLSVLAMTQRHPAMSKALIQEIENKLAVDENFINKVRSKLREQTYDARLFLTNKEDMQKAIRESSLHQHELLSHRQRQAENLRKYTDILSKCPTSETLNLEFQFKEEKRQKSRRSNKLRSTTNDTAGQQKLVEKWEEWQTIIHRRTGIADPSTFFTRLEASEFLEKQMFQMQVNAEKRTKELRQMVSDVEQELEEARYEAQAAGMQSGEIRDAQNQLQNKLREFQHLKERTDVADRLTSAALGGLKHICETLGMPPLDSDTQITDIINSIDEMLDALLEEKDRAQQKTLHPGSALATRLELPKETSMRASELHAALQQYETPKQRVAARLHGRLEEGKVDTQVEKKEKEALEEEARESRNQLKNTSQKLLKQEQRRQAREKTQEQQALLASN